jgi:hypothetical protein
MSTLNHDTELEEILRLHRALVLDANAVQDSPSRILATIKADDNAKYALNTYLYKQTLELIGPDIPLIYNGKPVQPGDKVDIDMQFHNGKMIAEFIQDNGKNVLKTHLRKAAAERWGQE